MFIWHVTTFSTALATQHTYNSKLRNTAGKCQQLKGWLTSALERRRRMNHVPQRFIARFTVGRCAIVDLQKVVAFILQYTSSWTWQCILLIMIFRLLVLTFRSIEYLHNESYVHVKHTLKWYSSKFWQLGFSLISDILYTLQVFLSSSSSSLLLLPLLQKQLLFLP